MLVHLLQNRVYKFKLHIQVEKLNFIVLALLEINSSTYKIYDGPGHLSNQLKLNNRSIVTTSAFQCMIYISSYFFLTNTFLEYYSQVHNITTSFNVTQFKYSLIKIPQPHIISYLLQKLWQEHQTTWMLPLITLQIITNIVLYVLMVVLSFMKRKKGFTKRKDQFVLIVDIFTNIETYIQKGQRCYCSCMPTKVMGHCLYPWTFPQLGVE